MKWLLIIGGFIILGIIVKIIEMIDNSKSQSPKTPNNIRPTGAYIVVTEQTISRRSPQKKQQASGKDEEGMGCMIFVIIFIILALLGKLFN